MLNDISGLVRLQAFLQSLGPGVMVGGAAALTVRAPDPVTDGADPGRSWLLVLGLAVLLAIASAVWVVVRTRRLEDRLWDEVVAGSEEILAGTVRTVSLPARVVRGRVKRGLPHFALAAGRGDAPSVAMAVTVVGDGPPRRVGALVPSSPTPVQRNTVLVVAVHPTRPEVGVLDDRVGALDLAAADRDPRWSGPLPTDRSISGGWVPAVGWAVAGGVAGAAVGFGLMGLAA